VTADEASIVNLSNRGDTSAMANGHTFHIPVMGTGFSIDTPLRVARFGIDSVMSLVDDALIERVRGHYCRSTGIPYVPIPRAGEDSRARRITAWLDLVAHLVAQQVGALKALPFAPDNDKAKYFEMLPDDSPLRRAYRAMCALPDGADKERLAAALRDGILPGSADVNIMTKLDRLRAGRRGALPELPEPLASDAKAALRGFARSRLDSNLVLSAGMNPTLLGYLETFPEFYRDAEGHARKGVILKVSDLRSALVQGKFLARKGIEVREFRIESGLNCGGHAFATDGELLGPILQQFREARASFHDVFGPLVRQYYEKKGRKYVGEPVPVRVTVQGGIGTFGEVRRLMEQYGVDATGWASPFLLVREATALDDRTRAQLAAATEADLYLSNASPLGVPFNNLRGSSSEVWTRARIDEGRPGSRCPRGYLASNTEFTDEPICTASREYQRAKLAELGFASTPSSDATDPRVRAVYDKACICNHLGNGALIDLGVAPVDAPVAVCPGPNLAYFGREYTLRELVDHIYGRGPSLVAKGRPHVFAKELGMNVDRFVSQSEMLDGADARGIAALGVTKNNLEGAIAHYRRLAAQEAFAGENLGSLGEAAAHAAARLAAAWRRLEDRASGPTVAASCAAG
jgi:hypothetical protein